MIENVIEELKSLSRDKLIQKWLELFGLTPSQYARKEFLVKHIAWEIQAQQKGGYTSQTKKKLESLSKALAQNNEIQDSNITKLKLNQDIKIKEGTKLIREYQGKNHEVSALDKGFKYKDKFYKSLSSIANEITGTRWNGKVFFGITKAKAKDEH